jgi:hypothetical protein
MCKYTDKLSEMNNQNNDEEKKQNENSTSWKSLFSNLYHVFKWALKISGIYFIWIFLHYSASHIYVEMCCPRTIQGFLISPFLMSTPHCQSLRWVIYNGANTINNMWIILGAWLSYHMMFLTTTTSTSNVATAHTSNNTNNATTYVSNGETKNKNEFS